MVWLKNLGVGSDVNHNQRLQVIRLTCQKLKRRAVHFSMKGAGAPTVPANELAWLNQETMHAGLGRLRSLDVFKDMGEELVVEECMKLDSRLVRDWNLRENQWKRPATLVARKFREGDASNYATFSPTAQLAVVSSHRSFSLGTTFW